MNREAAKNVNNLAHVLIVYKATKLKKFSLNLRKIFFKHLKKYFLLLKEEVICLPPQKKYFTLTKVYLIFLLFKIKS